jgi:alkylated DNA repair dioxygenase AlkB
MKQWAIFNDEAANYTEAESVEAAFWSKQEAETAIRERYHPDDNLYVHIVEEEEEDSAEEE